MLKTIAATLTLAFVAATASQAPARPVPRNAGHIVVHCPPAKGYARTCF
jgi:hypothetical protein